MRRDALTFVLLLLSFSVSMDISVAQQWEFYTTRDGLVGESIWSIQEDAKGYLWFITVFNGASRYDGVRFQNLNETNGLASNNIYFTLADKTGNFWVATDRGVSRFDGKGFESFDYSNGLADNNVHFILEDRDGNFWFGTEKGVSRYDGRDFQAFDDADGLVDNNVNFILEGRDGDLWFGTEKGVSKYDRTTFSTADLSEQIQVIFEDRNRNLWLGTKRGAYRKDVKSSMIEGPLVEADILSILEDQSGNLWFVTGNQGIMKYDSQGTNFESFTSQNGLGNNSVLSMLEDGRGNLWFGTDKGISRYDGVDFHNFTEVKGITLSFVRVILEDSDENLWFGTENGVCRYTIQNLQLFTEADGLADNSIEVIMEDRGGDLWFGTKDKGVSIYDGKLFQNFDVRDGLVDNSILSILQDSKGDLWFGTVSGISRYNGTNSAPVIGARAPMDTAVRAILEDKAAERMWFATEDGVTRYDGITFESWSIENGSEMFIDNGGNLWVGSWTDGIYKYDGKSWKQYTMEDGLGSNSITWILGTHGGNIWFGLQGGMTEAGGVCRYDGADFRNLTTDDGLVSDQVRVVLEDSNGTLWFGTDKGAVKYDTRQESPRFQTITKADGLISNNVTSISSDRDGNVWLGTDKGVSKYGGENFQNIPLDLTLGTIHAIFEDREGFMWFITTRDGVFKYIPTSKKVCPRIHITQIEADKIYHNVDNIRVNVDNIRVPSTTGRITFEYKGISFRTRPGEMRYSYQLQGYDETQLYTNDTRVHYENLKPGHYQFKVSATDSDLHKSDPPAAVDIETFRPLYLTPQFIISIILGGIGLLGGGGYLIVQLNRQRQTAAQLRERLRKQEEAERIQTAKMRSLRQLVAGLTHEMNNPIGVISSSTDVFSRTVRKIRAILTQEDPQEPKENKQLAKMLTVLKNTSQTSKVASERIARIVNDLRNFVRLDEAEWQGADVREGMDSAIALMELEFSSRIKVTKDYGDLPKIRCSPSSLNQVFMSILRNASEAIEGEGEIKVRTFIQDGHINIEISDTGRGISSEDFDRIFDPGFTTKSEGIGVGLGLSICHEIIVDEHKGRIDVSSELGKGTTFTISLPLYHRKQGDSPC
jgi:ligand-binding sensor domain-containing protein/nitrogen-specific signal transduction histidine kinase